MNAVGGVSLDVLQGVCLSLEFCYLSVTVRDNMDKNHQSVAYIIKTDAAIWQASGVCVTQSAELHLLVKESYNSTKTGLKHRYLDLRLHDHSHFTEWDAIDLPADLLMDEEWALICALNKDNQL